MEREHEELRKLRKERIELEKIERKKLMEKEQVDLDREEKEELALKMESMEAQVCIIHTLKRNFV